VKTRRRVLLAITDTHHGYLKGVMRYAREHRWHVVPDMIYTAKIPFGWRGDGIVSFIGYRNDLADFILLSGLPAVEITIIRSDLPLPNVEGDNQKIGEMAADHFLERGFRHFAWAPFMNGIVDLERYRSFSGKLARKGFRCHQLPPIDTLENVSNQRDWALRRRELARALQSLPKPLAVFAYNDCVATDIINTCTDAKLPIPEAVAVLGVDNDPLFCESATIPISSICHDLEGMAYEAAALLDWLMSGKRVLNPHVRVPPKGLVTRRSTDVLAVDNLQVARALRFIGDHHSDPQLSVNEVVAATKISRSTLGKAFRRELKRSINEEIVRVRLKKARDLLATTSLKVIEIASASGFARPNHFYRVFKKSSGLTPKNYQKRASSEHIGTKG
jgi:LacI family transcriptional regulator